MMRQVYIISTGDIIAGRTAGSQRVMKIAQSLAAVGIQVFLCSLPYISGRSIETVELAPGVSFLKSRNDGDCRGCKMRIFLGSLAGNILSGNSNAVIYLYPTTYVLKDFIYLIYFKFFKKAKFYCEINELRTAIALTPAPSGSLMSLIRLRIKSLIDYFVYKVNELQVPFYDGIVVISTALENHFSGLARKILRVPILCDADSIDDITEPSLHPDSPFKICFAGYIKFEKEGFNILYEALSRVTQNHKTELYLYGILEERDRVRLERLSSDYCLNDIVFYMGNIDPDRLPDEFRKYNLLILPRPLNRRTRYGFSTKLSEYLVSGIPVLVTDVSDNGSFIRDGYNGYIIPPGSSSAMADKILAIIREYNLQAGNVVKNAYQTVRERLDYRLYSKAYADFFWPSDQKRK